MEEDRAVIEGCYEGDGWYHDGNKGQLDYYIPFAIHFYGLLYAKFMVKEDPEYSYILKERGRKFADDFIYWFDKDGREIPYGRSLTYRFAHGAFFLRRPLQKWKKLTMVFTGALRLETDAVDFPPYLQSRRYSEYRIRISQSFYE